MQDFNKYERTSIYIIFRQSTLLIMIKIHQDRITRIAYATDASAYRELPYGVAYPSSTEEIIDLIEYAKKRSTSLIPRAGGTSLAGQVVGDGIVVDVSKNMNKIIEINTEEKWVRVQPGLVLDELNIALKSYGLFFSPETSTSNRCCLGGMVGNNSCGSHSLVYGSTRDHLLEARVILSDGYETTFKPLSEEEFNLIRLHSPSLVEKRVYQYIYDLLTDQLNRNKIVEEFPDPNLPRRNTGYAIDEIMNCELFTDSSSQKFNLCKLLAGSEGTLVFITELKLNLTPLPPPHEMLVAVHCNSFQEAFSANLVALEHQPTAIEMIDHNILELSARNITQNKNRAFIVGDPKAIILIEFAEQTEEALLDKAALVESSLKQKGLGYAYVRLINKEISNVWALRKAGLGLLSSMPGDAKPVPLTEDTAVAPQRLADYIAEFDNLLASHGLSCVYYGHIATGELHLRPILNLKNSSDVVLFHTVGKEVAQLVKKHKGSLSGEHGDGRLRGEFIPIMYGDEVYEWFRQLKRSFDPDGVFNPNKIVDTPPMNQFMRFLTDGKSPEIDSFFSFFPQNGVLQSIEQCNGSADCRKSILFGGTMCPTYRASGDETLTTRARANVLRELISRPYNKSIFSQPEIVEILSLCLSCKACKSECPSNVDMAKIKAEVMQLVHDEKGIPFRTFLIANLHHIQKLFSHTPWLYNAVVDSLIGNVIKSAIGFSSNRSIPKLSSTKWQKQLSKRDHSSAATNKGVVYLFIDEFTRHNESHIAVKAKEIIQQLGYTVIIAPIEESGRTHISKGLVRQATKIATKNVKALHSIINSDTPLIGIEPSCLLTLRDEYLSFNNEDFTEEAKRIAQHSFLFDEWITKTFRENNLNPADYFKDEEKEIIFHAHCHQKSLASSASLVNMLSLPKGYRVKEIPSGCCGMAGAFGYEKEHYDLSMQIGELKLFPTVRAASSSTIVVAGGTSCRTHIKDGTGKTALHPIEALWNAMIVK